MPRAPDPELPNRILDAADALWREGADAAVTIRAVADQAATTTPTVYAYFKDRHALVVALRARAYQRFLAFMTKSSSFRNSCERHLEFAERHSHDYELLYGRGWLDRTLPETQEAEINQFAAVLIRNGVPERSAMETAFPILMILQGLAMHRIHNPAITPLSRRIRAASIQACLQLVESAQQGKRLRATDAAK